MKITGKFLHIIISLFFLLSGHVIYSTTDNRKHITPYIKNYPTYLYKGNPLVWDIVEGKNGEIFFANSESGVVYYNGTVWNNIQLFRTQSVRSMDRDENGTIFVGSIGDFGFLKKSQGSYQYVSLMSLIPENEKNFSDVWQTIATPKGIYFRTRNTIYRFYGNKITVIKAKTAFQRMAFLHNVIYVYQMQIGLMKIEENSISLKIGFDFFNKNKLMLYSYIALENNKILFVSRGKGLYVYDGNHPKPFYTEVDRLINTQDVYTAILLKNGNIAIGTKDGGIFIISNEGKSLYQINKDSGLIDNTIYSLYEDSEQGLWVGTSNGISRIDFQAPITFYNQTIGFKGHINSIIKHNGLLYIATPLGLFKEIKTAGQDDLKFIKINEINTSALNFMVYDNFLIVGSTAGIYIINEDKVHYFNLKRAVISLLRSKKHKNYIFVGTGGGLLAINFSDGNVKNVIEYNGIKTKINSFAEDENGKLWVSTRPGEILCLDTSKNINPPASIVNYSTNTGLPDVTLSILSFNKKFFITGKNEIFEYDKKNNIFVPSPLFEKFPKNLSIKELIFSNETLFIRLDTYSGIYKLDKNESDKYDFKKMTILNAFNIGITSIFVDNNVIWFGTPQTLIKYDPKPKNLDVIKYSPLITEVLSQSQILYGQTSEEALINYGNNKLMLPYKFNSLQISFSQPFYGFEEATLYRYKLERNNKNFKEWSAWSKNTSILFSNLSEGNYTFSVKAQNVFGRISKTTSFIFEISPPWYRSYYAYFLYIIFFIFVVFIFSYLRSYRLKLKTKKLENEKNALEEKVNERTKELSDAYKIIKEDLNLAKRIQTNLISKEYKLFKDLNIHINFEPMIEVGGDIYDIYKLNENYYRIFVADATGHGIQGALTSMIIKSEYDKTKLFQGTPDKLLNYLNTIFIMNYSNLTVYFTCIIIDIDLKNNKIYYSNAGHHHFFHIQNNAIHKLHTNGKIIGVVKNYEYEFKTADFLVNDKLFIFTDGLFEEFNENNEELGLEGIEQLLKENINLNLEDIATIFVNNIYSWIGDNGINDDITLVSIENVKK